MALTCKFHLETTHHLYLVAPPFGHRLGATWLPLGHERLWLNLEVLLTGTSYLNSLETFSNIIQYQFRKHMKASIFVCEDTDPGRERL